MTFVLAENWWSLLIRGLVGIIFAFLTFVWPAITLGAVVLLFGAYALIDGVVSIMGARKAARSHDRWGVLVLEGVAGIAAAAITVLWPSITAFALVYIIAAWMLVTGFFEIAAAIRLRKHISGEWLLAVSGIASILFGVLMIGFPLVGALAIAYMVGFYCLTFGMLMIALGFRLRGFSKSVPGTISPTAVPIQH
jgi:uncharacterized membrane protein HdeD (DUF308 family)